MTEYKLGIDLGGTKIEGVVIEAAPPHRECFRKRVPTNQSEGYDAILDRLRQLYAEMVDSVDQRPHTFGIGTPGSISSRTGLMKNSNTLCLNDKPLQNDLQHLLNRPVTLLNDANAFALAEAIMGAGQGYSWVFGVIMGTGCGGGLVVDGVVRVGPQSIAGEWGHMVIDPVGPKCYCGRRGCVETLISGSGLEGQFRDRYQQDLSAREIIARAHDGDPGAESLHLGFLENFGHALANLITILDPDAVVLGGGLSNLEELYSEGIDRVRAKIFNDSLETPILKNQLGDSAGVLGAALCGV